jgi:hypothetical protein
VEPAPSTRLTQAEAGRTPSDRLSTSQRGGCCGVAPAGFLVDSLEVRPVFVLAGAAGAATVALERRENSVPVSDRQQRGAGAQRPAAPG